MNDWTPSETCPGYREKTIQYGDATIVIRRPILSEGEQARREKYARDALGNILHGYVRRKEENHGR